MDYISNIFSSSNVNAGVSILDSIISITLVLSVVAILYLIIVELIRRRRFVYYRVIPHREDNTKIDDIKSMMIAIHNVKHKRIVRWILRHDWKSLVFYRDKEGKIYYYVGVDKSLGYQVERAFKITHNRCHFTEIDKDKLPLPSNKHIGGRLILRKKFKKESLPLSPIKTDFLSNLIYSLPNAGWIKIDLKTEKEKDLDKSISEAEEEYKDVSFQERTGVQRSELSSLQRRFQTNEVSFRTYISMATDSENGSDKLKSLSQLVSSKMNYENELVYRKFRNGVTFYPRRVGSFLVPDAGRMITTGKEIANIFHLPNYSKEDDYIVEEISKDTELYDKTIEMLNEGIFNHESGVSVGYAELADGTERNIKVRLDSLKDHCVVTGKTGAGKSSFIVAILDGLMKDNIFNEGDYAGLTFLDPGRDTALTLFNRILKYEKEGGNVNWERVNYIPLKTTEFPLALNLLDKDVDVSHSVIADAVTNIIESAIEDRAPIAERLMKKSIETLLADDRPHTILEVAMLINDKDTTYRNEVLKRVKKNPANYDIVNYWEQDADQNIKTSGVALKNRIDIISQSPILKNVFGQTNNEFDFKKMLDEGYINLIDLSGLRDSELKIISGYISFRMYTASLGRSAKSKFHLLAFDETKTMGDLEYVTRIVAETRKFNLATLVGSQTFGQLNRNMKRALKDVQDNFISLLQGESESEEVASFLSDGRVQITSKDLTSLDSTSREGYIALKDTPEGSSKKSRYTVKVKIDPLTKYDSNGLAVKFQSSEETKAVDWSEEIANLNRIYHTGVKHKDEIAFELMQIMQPYKKFSKDDIYKYTSMTKEEMYNINSIRENGYHDAANLKEDIPTNDVHKLEPINVSSKTVIRTDKEDNMKTDLEPIEEIIEQEEINETEVKEEEEELKAFNEMGLSNLKEKYSNKKSAIEKEKQAETEIEKQPKVDYSEPKKSILKEIKARQEKSD